MAMYAVRPYNGPYGDFEISTLFWGALIFLALFVSCFLAWKAIDRLRNRRQFDGSALEGGHARHPENPRKPGRTRRFQDRRQIMTTAT